MKYIWKNICAFIQHNTFLFLLVVISTAGSCIMIHFAYGLYENYQLKREYEMSGQREVVISLEDNFQEVSDPEIDDVKYLKAPEKLEQYVTTDMMKDFVKGFGSEFNTSLNYIDVTTVVEDLPLRCQFSVKDGAIANSPKYEEEIDSSGELRAGRYFSETEYTQGEPVAVCFDYIHINTACSPVTYSMLSDKNHMMIQGKKYKIIGYGCIDIDLPIVPITSLQGDTPLSGMIKLEFEKPISKDQFQLIQQQVDTVFGDLANLGVLALPNDDAIYLYNTILIIAVLITMMSAMNFAILYRYILSTRKHDLMVYRICGLSFWKIVRMYLGECLAISVSVYVVSAFIFSTYLLPKVVHYYEYMNQNFSVIVFVILFLVYFVVSALILLGMIVFSLQRDEALQVKGGYK